MTPWTCVACVASGRGAFLQFGATCHEATCQLKSSTGISDTRKRKQTEFFEPPPFAKVANTEAPAEQWWDEHTLFSAIFDALDEPIPPDLEELETLSLELSDAFELENLELSDAFELETLLELSDAFEAADMLPEPIPEALEPDLPDELPPSPSVDTGVELKPSRQLSLTGVLFDILVDA